MWMEDDEYSNDWDDSNDEVEMELNETPKRVNKSRSKPNQDGDILSNSKRTYDDSVQTDQEAETEDKTNGLKRRPREPKIINNVNLRKVGIDEFLYPYKAGDGSPLIRYIYPEADGRRELLVIRSKRAEVNSFLKVIHRELIRHMSVYSRILVFENPDKLYQEAMMASQWSLSGLHTMVPFSTTAALKPASNQPGTKRRNTNGSVSTAVPAFIGGTRNDHQYNYRFRYFIVVSY